MVMTKLIITAAAIFAIAVLMTMTGRGGGNFYVVALVVSGLDMHQAATTGQFILFVSALFATLLFGKKRSVEWRLALFIGSLTAVSAFAGGYFSDWFAGKTLKLIFSGFLCLAAALMLRPVKEKKGPPPEGRSYWTLRSGEHQYVINLWLAVPLILATGFAAGMVGVSGGSFLVPLMVLACSVPMHIAVGTSTTLVSITALTGFMGHALEGHFDPRVAVPLALAGAVGGLIGGSFALKTKPAYLKQLFAYTTFAAAAFMLYNAMMSKGP